MTTKPMINLDGSLGEGGGQILRTALSLSVILKQPIEIKNIRSGRKKPGLMRQHLTSLLAAKEICHAEVEGAELGSQHIRFYPGEVRPGHYDFKIGTAGSTVLVCQTILLPLALSGGSSTVTFQGGTHNGLSPSLTFFEQSFKPALRSMGLSCRVHTDKLGFFPAGGGKWQIEIDPITSLTPCSFNQTGAEFELQNHCHMLALVAGINDSIGKREIKAAQTILNWQANNASLQRPNSYGPGNSFHLSVGTEAQVAMFEQIGKLGLSAEKVAYHATQSLKYFLESGAQVEEYLADQLLLPMALAGSGRFTTTKPSSHTLTNIEVIKTMTGIAIQSTQLNDTLWEIYLEKGE